jgi:hypothetical protein
MEPAFPRPGYPVSAVSHRGSQQQEEDFFRLMCDTIRQTLGMVQDGAYDDIFAIGVRSPGV